MTCIVCMGDIEDKLTTFSVDIDGTLYVVKEVPSHVCSQCGEVSYSYDVSQRLEDIVLGMKAQMEAGVLDTPTATATYTVSELNKLKAA